MAERNHRASRRAHRPRRRKGLFSPRTAPSLAAGLLAFALTAGCGAGGDESGQERGTEDPPSSGRTPRSGNSPDPAAAVPRTSLPERELRVRPAQLAMGHPPRIEYMDWTAVVDPSGARTELEKGPIEGNEQEGRTYSAFARFGSGWLTNTDSFGSALVVHDFDGSKATSPLLGERIVATSRDGGRVLMDYPPVVLGPGPADSLTWRGKGFGNAEGAGFLGPGDAVFSHGNRTYRGRADGTTAEMPGIADAIATSQTKNWVIGYPKGPDREVTGVFDAGTSRQLLRSPDYTLLGVDPTGSSLLGSTGLYPPFPDLVIATSAGRGLVHLSGAGLQWSTPRWEDRRHLLAVAATPRNVQYVVRVGIDGKVELAAGPSTGDHYDSTVLPVPHS